MSVKIIAKFVNLPARANICPDVQYIVDARRKKGRKERTTAYQLAKMHIYRTRDGENMHLYDFRLFPIALSMRHAEVPSSRMRRMADRMKDSRNIHKARFVAAISLLVDGSSLKSNQIW